MSIFKKISQAVRRYGELSRMPLRLEFVVTDWCNLNCRGCGHYSPLARKEFAPIDELRKTMAALGRACGGDIESAYLIGGETLLYPDLNEAMEALRSAFPTAKLYIFTNGLLLPRMDDDFWASARKYDFVMALTRYPIRFDYDAAEALCAAKGVRCEVFADRNLEGSFFKFPLDPAKKQNGRMAHFRCYNRGCISVLGDKVYPCSISGCVGHLNKALGTNFRHEEGDYIAVGDVRSARDIKRLRDRVVPFCSYCKHHEVRPYAPSRRELSEWL